jgi:hypothetical protein
MAAAGLEALARAQALVARLASGASALPDALLEDDSAGLLQRMQVRSTGEIDLVILKKTGRRIA